MTDCMQGYMLENNNDCKECCILKRNDLTQMNVQMIIFWKGIIRQSARRWTWSNIRQMMRTMDDMMRNTMVDRV